ncbi:hypothetical protein FFF34_007880 [Inquilinus sp. KBS0705]|nr:hypothetical protein FFF34_007880 [Inquilinus sp. KBS0705]
MNYTQEELQRSSHESAFQLYATYYLYAIRARNKEKYIQAITLLGFLVPVMVAGLVISYSYTGTFAKLYLQLLAPVALVQLILSALALIYKWDDKRNYYLESAISNRQLYDQFTHLAKFPHPEMKDNTHDFEILIYKSRAREDQDDKYPLTDKELRRGMRYALRQYQKACSGCGVVPTSMESTDCNVCGKFNFYNV